MMERLANKTRLKPEGTNPLKRVEAVVVDGDRAMGSRTTPEGVAYERARPLKRPDGLTPPPPATAVAPAAPARRLRRRTLAPGLTLLEVVLAVVILGLVAAAISGAISTVEAMNARSRQMVAAYELAHRLILTWLDDQKRMPAQTLPLDYGPYTFMWDMQEDSVRMVINEAQKANSGASPQALSRFKLVSINVYMSEGDPRQPYKGPLLASLNRLYDPAAPRNPESMKNLNDLDNLGRLLRDITGQDIPIPNGGSGGPGNRNNNGGSDSKR